MFTKTSSSPVDAEHAGLSDFARARIALHRDERRRAAAARGCDHKLRRDDARAALEIVPFSKKPDLLIEAIAMRNAADAALLVGFVAFVAAILIAHCVLGDMPGMATALAAGG